MKRSAWEAHQLALTNGVAREQAERVDTGRRVFRLPFDLVRPRIAHSSIEESDEVAPHFRPQRP